MFLTYKTTFDAAHQIPDSDELITKKCARKHGHTYRLKLMLDLDLMKAYYMKEFIDFALIKRDVDKLLDKYDHVDITEFYNLHTVEEIAEDLMKQLRNHFGANSEVEIRFELSETDKFGVYI